MHAVDLRRSDLSALDVDQRVFLHGVSWQDYERLLSIRGDESSPRIAYLAGEIELMSPSRSHERLKKLIARLVEAFAEERQLPLNGFGSWTLKSQAEERAAEPDECYSLGPPREVPDLVLEVVWSHGGIDKLDIYRRLGVREVWVWRERQVSVFVLRGDAYEQSERTELMPDLDLAELLTFADWEDQTAAVRAFRERVRG